MKNFGVLYRYEFKKLLSKKIVRFSFLLGVAIIILSLFVPLMGDYYVDGKFIGTNYEMYRMDRDYARRLSGREIDQSLLEETVAAYRRIPDTPGAHYTSTEEYQKYARPYSGIFNFIRNISGMQTSEIMLSWQPDEEDLYAKRQVWLMSLWEDLRLTKGETDFWREREERIKTPYVYEERGGCDMIILSYQTVGFLMLILMAICLSGMFSDEHTRKTDQIVLSSPLGKEKLYWAKMAVGVSFAMAGTILFFTLIILSVICLYGAGGFQAAFQLIYAQSSDPVTCGQAVIIAYGNMLIAAAVVSIIVMVLSELLNSSIATLAILTGLLMMPMVIDISEQYRALRQIWTWLPWAFLAPWNVFGSYTVSVFHHYFAPWQAVPVIYLASGVLIAVMGKVRYRRFQVCGR